MFFLLSALSFSISENTQLKKAIVITIILFNFSAPFFTKKITALILYTKNNKIITKSRFTKLRAYDKIKSAKALLLCRLMPDSCPPFTGY